MICDKCRDEKELKLLYSKRPMPNQYDWDWLISNPHLFCFYDEENGKLRGYITVQREEGKLTLSGASYRKNMADNVNAIILVCEAFNEDMYSFTTVRPAIMALLRAGFKHIKDDMYIRRKQNG